MKNLLLMAAFAAILFSCGPKIYKSPNLDNAISTHKTVAILPAMVTMKLRPNEMKKMAPEQFEEIAMRTGYDVQEQMHSWLLKRADKFNYTVSFQDIMKTNSLLKEGGVAYSDIQTTDAAKLARMLGVDAIMTTRMNMDKPMSDGAAVAMAILVGVYGSTNNVVTNLAIRDAESGQAIWKYDYDVSGSIGSSSTKLVDALMRNASKKFPYSARN